MKIRLLRNTVVNRQPHAAGTVLETDERQAQYLIAIKKAEAVPELVKIEPETQTITPPEKAVITPKRGKIQ